MASSVMDNHFMGKPNIPPLMMYYGHESGNFKIQDKKCSNSIMMNS